VQRKATGCSVDVIRRAVRAGDRRSGSLPPFAVREGTEAALAVDGLRDDPTGRLQAVELVTETPMYSAASSSLKRIGG